MGGALLTLVLSLQFIFHEARIYYIINAHGAYLGETKASRQKWNHDTVVWFFQKHGDALDTQLGSDIHRIFETKGPTHLPKVKTAVTRGGDIPFYVFKYGVEFRLMTGISQYELTDDAKAVKEGALPELTEFRLIPVSEKTTLFKLDDVAADIDKRETYTEAEPPVIIWLGCMGYNERPIASVPAVDLTKKFVTFDGRGTIAWRNNIYDQLQTELRRIRLDLSIFIPLAKESVERQFASAPKKKKTVLKYIDDKSKKIDPKEQVDWYDIAFAVDMDSKKEKQIYDFIAEEHAHLKGVPLVPAHKEPRNDYYDVSAPFEAKSELQNLLVQYKHDLQVEQAHTQLKREKRNALRRKHQKHKRKARKQYSY